MANARLRTSWEISDNTDYSRATVVSTEETLTPDEWRLGDTVEVGTGSTTYKLDHLNSVSRLKIENTDGDNYVDVTWDTTDGTANTCRVSAEEVTELTDVDPSADLTLQADTAAVGLKISYLGT